MSFINTQSSTTKLHLGKSLGDKTFHIPYSCRRANWSGCRRRYSSACSSGCLVKVYRLLLTASVCVHSLVLELQLLLRLTLGVFTAFAVQLRFLAASFCTYPHFQETFSTPHALIHLIPHFVTSKNFKPQKSQNQWPLKSFSWNRQTLTFCNSHQQRNFPFGFKFPQLFTLRESKSLVLTWTRTGITLTPIRLLNPF